MGGNGSGLRPNENLQRVGALLKHSTLSYREIGKEVGLSGERIRQLRTAYFPETPRRLQGQGQRKDSSDLDYILLMSGVTDVERAEVIGCSVGHVRNLRQKAEARNGRWSVEIMKRRMVAMLRQHGYGWCWGCKLAKCFDEFSATARAVAGRLCRDCNTARQVQVYRDRESVREYVRRYQREHPEKAREWQARYRRRKILARVAEHSDDLAKAVLVGEISLEDAANQIRPSSRRPRSDSSPGITRHKVTVEGFLRAARRLPESERLRLKELLK